MIQQDLHQKALRDSKLQPMWQLAEKLDDAVFWVTDWQKQVITYVSPSYETIWGRPREELYQDPLSWIQAIHPEDQSNVDAEFFKKVSKGEFDETFRIIRPDKSIRHIHDRGITIKNEKGTVTHIVGIAQDITDSLEHDDEYQQMKSEFERMENHLHMRELEMIQLKIENAELRKKTHQMDTDPV